MSPLCQTHIKPEQSYEMEAYYPLHVYVCDQCLLDIVERAHIPFWNLREGAWRLEEWCLLIVANDNGIE
jgi:hypothetical protein